jgi:glycosyltransferase involved in cell wall biosynthesis
MIQTALSNSPEPASSGSTLRIAVLLPCYNEAVSVGSVVDSFRKALPSAAIYVYDNNSTDETSKIAAAHGAIVRREGRQGKGHVVRRGFGDIDADVYVLADGDGTYDAACVPLLIRTLRDGPYDVVNAARVE